MTDLSVDAPLLTGRSPSLSIDGKVAALAAVILAGGAAALSSTISWRQGALYLLGGALGLSLRHALFGFTSAWRVFMADRRGAGLRAQMNVGAYFSGIASGSLHGWFWLVAAFAGSIIGTGLRPVFGLSVEYTKS
jgi:uncharacterized membrane protein YedE/YeeE